MAGEGAAQAAGSTDITDASGTISDQNKITGKEGYDKAIDNVVTTKYLTYAKSTWLQFQPQEPALVDRYTLVSANDAPDRDPKDWTVEGSDDASTWAVLDTRTNETFPNRNQKRVFAFSKADTYQYYRLNIKANSGSPATQLAEWELWSAGDGAVQPPTGLTVARVTDTEADIAWNYDLDVDARPAPYPPTGFEVQRAADGGDFSTIASSDKVTDMRYTDTTLAKGKTYTYRVRALGLGANTSPYTETAKASELSELDITDSDGTVTDQYRTSGDEGVDKVIDNFTASKYFTGHKTTFLQYEAPTRSVATRYTLTSANDAQDRDPTAWTFQGSSDGANWTTLDTRSSEGFGKRLQRRSFAFPNTVPFRFYRLNISANAGGSDVQLSEWQIFAAASEPPAPPVPSAPTELSATAFSGDQVRLSWQDNSPRWERTQRLERSENGDTWTLLRSMPPGETAAVDHSLDGETKYSYRVIAENVSGRTTSAVVSVTTKSKAMPETWKEHGLGHDALVTKVFEDENVAIYGDSDYDKSQTWINDFTSRLWGYTKKNYGTDFSSPKLMVILHREDLGGHAAGALSASHDYRNVIDVGLTDWSEENDTFRDVVSHEMAHVVEAWSGGVEGSPSFGLWRDSKWAEIYQYDAYVGAGMQADADRWHTKMMKNRDSFPQANTAWFANWFYPLWRDHGQGKVLARYFDQLASDFSHANGKYTSALNWGEFVHFWSGAAGVNLKSQATNAFGWPATWTTEFADAQADYPGVTYTGK